MPMLEVEKIHRNYGTSMPEGISLTVDKARSYIDRRKRAGKSTTLRSITGTVKPRDGHIRLEVRTWLRTRPRDRHRGMPWFPKDGASLLA